LTHEPFYTVWVRVSDTRNYRLSLSSLEYALECFIHYSMHQHCSKLVGLGLMWQRMELASSYMH